MGGRIVIVGSGETAPTMVKVHRVLIEQAGAGARAMLDTPFGFQANADDLTEKVLEYFADSVGERLEVARWRRRDEPVADRERSLALLARSSFVFAGPGSPTYALRQWQETPVPRALVDVVGRGGTVVLGSAAAVTVGSYAVPVYEIYKVGEDPSWLPGLDLLGQLTGISAAVIPHFDNREGGRHDTRYCYLGSQRLESMEAAGLQRNANGARNLPSSILHPLPTSSPAPTGTRNSALQPWPGTVLPGSPRSDPHG